MARQKRQFTEEEINQIKSMYNEGKSILGIATQLHTTNRIINSLITELGLKRPTNPSNKPSKAALYRKREAIRKAIDELIKEMDYCSERRHHTTGAEQAEWKAKGAEIRKQIQALRKEGLATYINEDAEAELCNKLGTDKIQDVSEILKHIKMSEDIEISAI